MQTCKLSNETGMNESDLSEKTKNQASIRTVKQADRQANKQTQARKEANNLPIPTR